MENSQYIKNSFRNYFEPQLLDEIANCPLMRREKEVGLRHEVQSLVRFTPFNHIWLKKGDMNR